MTRLRQILVNLVANAIKFTEQGEVFVEINRIQNAGGLQRLHFEIRDTGVGIPADRMGRLFQAFSQVDASTTRRFGGTGLGLAISHRLVTVMGGQIWVESEVGKGTIFKFEIPLVPAEMAYPVAYGKRSARSLEGVRILIVDDNETNRWILKTQTASWGMVPSVASSAGEALLQLREGETPQLILLDVVMPDMDGYALAAEIRKTHSASQMQIVILTSWGDEKRDLAGLGISSVLTKPVKSTPLFNALSQILGVGDHLQADGSAIHEDESQFAACHPMRILMAEDNKVNQRVSQMLLEKLGYEVTFASDGREALGKISEEHFDLVFMDVQMPEMDGFEATREICRTLSASERPWIVALTAHAIEGDRDDCLVAGMDDYLAKPIRREHLKKALSKAFRSLRERQ